MISGVDPEGDSGLYMLAHDTEGNELGIYSMKK
jgi:predicted enzyme related to lactoylglutathione lyase